MLIREFHILVRGGACRHVSVVVRFGCLEHIREILVVMKLLQHHLRYIFPFYCMYTILYDYECIA